MNISIKKNKLKGGGGELSRPVLHGEITPHADLVKQVIYLFLYTTPFRKDISDFKEYIITDESERKNPQLGDSKGKGEYIIDLVYNQEDEGRNDYRDIKSRIQDLMYDQHDKYGQLHKELSDKERLEFDEVSAVPDVQNEINKIKKEIDATEVRFDHLGYIEDYLTNYKTDVHIIPPEGKYTELGKRSSRNLEVATMTSGGKKWSKKYKAKINCKNPKGFSQKQYCKYGRKKMKGGGGNMSLLSTPTNAYDPYIEVPDSDGHPIICPICMRGFEYGKPNVLVCGGVYGKETGEGCQSAFHWDCWEEMKKTTRKRTCPVCRRNPTTLYLKELIDNITPERILIDQAKPKWDWPHSRKWFDGDLRSIDVNTGLSKRGGGKRKTKRKKSKRRNTRRKMKGGGGTFSRVAPDNTYLTHTDSTGVVSTIIPRNSVSPEPQKRYIYFTFSKIRFSNKYKAEEVTIEQLKLGDWRLPNLYDKEDILVLLNELKDHYEEINRVTEEGGRYLDERYLEYRFPFYTYNERPIYQDYNQSKHAILKIDAMINYFNNTENLTISESQIMNRHQRAWVQRHGGKNKRRTRRKRINLNQLE